MERNVSYATMVSTGEQPDITIHLTGFNEGNGIRFLTEVEGKNPYYLRNRGDCE